MEANLNTGTANLTLSAAQIVFAPDALAVSLRGGAVSLTSSGVVTPDMRTARDGCVNCHITVIASGNLTLEGNFYTGSRSNLSLTSIGGAINFGGATTTLSGRIVSLTATGTPSASDAALTIEAERHVNVGAAVNTGTGALTINAGRNANINADITTTGNLTITANMESGGARSFAILFSTARAMILDGADITLTTVGANAAAPRASNQNLEVAATGVLTINANINNRHGHFDAGSRFRRDRLWLARAPPDGLRHHFATGGSVHRR